MQLFEMLDLSFYAKVKNILMEDERFYVVL